MSRQERWVVRIFCQSQNERPDPHHFQDLIIAVQSKLYTKQAEKQQRIKLRYFPVTKYHSEHLCYNDM